LGEQKTEQVLRKSSPFDTNSTSLKERKKKPVFQHSKTTMFPSRSSTGEGATGGAHPDPAEVARESLIQVMAAWAASSIVKSSVAKSLSIRLILALIRASSEPKSIFPSPSTSNPSKSLPSPCNPSNPDSDNNGRTRNYKRKTRKKEKKKKKKRKSVLGFLQQLVGGCHGDGST